MNSKKDFVNNLNALNEKTQALLKGLKKQMIKPSQVTINQNTSAVSASELFIKNPIIAVIQQETDIISEKQEMSSKNDSVYDVLGHSQISGLNSDNNIEFNSLKNKSNNSSLELKDSIKNIAKMENDFAKLSGIINNGSQKQPFNKKDFLHGLKSLQNDLQDINEGLKKFSKSKKERKNIGSTTLVAKTKVEETSIEKNSIFSNKTKENIKHNEEYDFNVQNLTVQNEHSQSTNLSDQEPTQKLKAKEQVDIEKNIQLAKKQVHFELPSMLQFDYSERQEEGSQEINFENFSSDKKFEIEEVPKEIDGVLKEEQGEVYEGLNSEDADLWFEIVADNIADTDDVNQVRELFFEEYADINPIIMQDFRKLKSGNNSGMSQLKRNLHTIKGSVRMIGASSIGLKLHELETSIEQLEMELKSAKSGSADFSNQANTLEEKYFIVQKMTELLKNPPQKTQKKGTLKAKKILDETTISASQAVTVRVSQMLLDGLNNQASEARLTVTSVFEMNGLLGAYINDLYDGIGRLGKMLRELEINTESQMQSRKKQIEEYGEAFDPLEFDRFDRLQEITRFLSEGLGDILDIHQSFSKVNTEQEGLLYNQEQMVDDIQQNLASTRLTEFKKITDRFYKVVTQTSMEVDKKVNLVIEGEGIELDRTLLEKIVAPVEHLLRNSIAHGIEPMIKRKSIGKPDHGTIKISISQSEGRILLEVQDDGTGVNIKKVKEKAIEKGLIKSNTVLTDSQIVDLIFLPGFSTADTVSQVAGRGVGMDVVKSDILAIGGRLDTSSDPGVGLTVKIDIPSSISSISSLLIKSNEQIWGFPVKYLEEVRCLSEDDLQEAYKNGLQENGKKLPIYYFPHLAGFSGAPLDIKKYNHLVLFKDGNAEIAVHVPNLMGTKEIQLKPLGKAFTRIGGLQGAFIMPDGSVGYMVEPIKMIIASHIKTDLSTTSIVHKRIVMVVDDSTLIRKVTSKLLEREGFDVLTAKNGEEGLDVLQEKVPDVILLDVEMPKMDGFEFTKNIKAHSKYKDIPIIMITSRTAEKHKNHALSLGVNEYLGKPFKEDELLMNIAKVLKLQKKVN